MERLEECPGCGAAYLPLSWAQRIRANASAACWERYTAVLGHETEHLPRLGRLHQLTVDAYGAQHGGGSAPPIGLAFGLIGLHLALDDGWSGLEVRDAHASLAARFRRWPAFTKPSRPDWLTVAYVSAARTPEGHAERVDAWAASVWEAWRGEHDHVRAWAESALPPAERQRIRAGS